MIFHCYFVVYLLAFIARHAEAKPNIIFMFGDDVGFNDVQFTSASLDFTSSTTQTPHMNQLATEEGVILSSYYVHRMCSPTRAALLTGRYSFRYGMASSLLQPDINVALTRQVSLLSEEFKAAGYSTHAIGKWHLGFQSWEYTPTYRGFDSYYGYWNAFADYFNSNYDVVVDGVDLEFYDLRRDEEEAVAATDFPLAYSLFRFRDEAMSILTNHAQSLEEDSSTAPFLLYLAWQSSHVPSQAPTEYSELYSDAPTTSRQYDQAQTTCMDDMVHELVHYLKDSGLWDNTLLVFSSDNGGEATIGDNFPLRGYKRTLFEGGLRVPAFVTGGYLSESQRGTTVGGDGEYMHVVDWYPTLLEAAGLTLTHAKSTKRYSLDADVDIEWEDIAPNVPLDGVSFWDAIQNGETRDELSDRLVVLDVMGVDKDSGAMNGTIRWGKWKYMKGLGTLIDYDGDDGWLWGESFDMLRICGDGFMGDEHLWGHDFASHLEENALGCDLTAGAVNIWCFYSVYGCLFNLEEDPCEMVDVSEEHPVVFETLKLALQDLVNEIPTDVVSDDRFVLDMESVANGQQWLPEYAGEFWSPWQEYPDAVFETVLAEDYARLYGYAVDEDEESQFVDVSTRSVGEMIVARRYSTLVMIVAPLVMCVVLVLFKSRCFTKGEGSAVKVGLMEDDGQSDYGSVSF